MLSPGEENFLINEDNEGITPVEYKINLHES